MNFSYEYEIVSDVSIFDHIIKLHDLLYPKFIGIKSEGNTTHFEFNSALDQYEHDALNVVVDNYGPTNTHYKIINGMKDIQSSRVFGNWMVDYVSARNKVLEKTDAQMMGMATDLQSVMAFLQIGSVQLAYGILLQLEAGAAIPNANYYDYELEEDKKLVGSYLGLR